MSEVLLKPINSFRTAAYSVASNIARAFNNSVAATVVPAQKFCAKKLSSQQLKNLHAA